LDKKRTKIALRSFLELLTGLEPVTSSLPSTQAQQVGLVKDDYTP